MDSVGGVVSVMWHADSIMRGGRRCSQCRFDDVARRKCRGGGGRHSQCHFGDVARRGCRGWW